MAEKTAKPTAKTGAKKHQYAISMPIFSDSGPLHGELVAGNIVITKGEVEILSVSKADAKSAAGVLLALSR